MGKGANKQLMNNAGSASSIAASQQKQAGQIYGQIDPILTKQATDPQGYNPADLNAMNTASQQSLGGSTAGITGQANLTAARTRNAGGFQGAIRSGSQEAMKDQSQNALGIQAQNAQLKQQQQQQALTSLQQLYGIDNGTAVNYLNSSNTALNDENQASGANGLLGKSLIAGISSAGAAAGAFCPARGSLYLMADGSEKLIEDLRIGDSLQGIDGQPETIEEIQKAIVPVLRVVTEDGHDTRNSRSHAFALPFGGFVVAMHSRDAIVRTAKGSSKIVSNAYDGEDEVFNVITNGSHTYRADGIWALGVGEAERHVSMEQWNEIGDKLEALA